MELKLKESHGLSERELAKEIVDRIDYMHYNFEKREIVYPDTVDGDCLEFSYELAKRILSEEQEGK